MEKRLKNYLTYINNISSSKISDEKLDSVIDDLLIQIQFFQHERLIHLIVTIGFAILTFIAIVLCLLYPSYPIFIMVALLLCLLVPYIRHYFILENGVQKLYQYYDLLINHQKEPT